MTTSGRTRTAFPGLFQILLVALLVASCGILQRAAPYDPKVETTVLEFNEAVLTHIEKMQGLSKLEKGEYGENVDFYATWKVRLEILRNHAIAQEVGDSCGPEQITDDIIRGGFRTLNAAMQKAQAAVDAARQEHLQPALQWASAKRDRLKEQFAEAEKTLNAASAADADVARLEARVGSIRAKYERWAAAANRISGAIAAVAGKANAGDAEGSTAFEGGCTTRLVTNLAEQFAGLERFHMKQQGIGIPPRVAPAVLMSVPIQVILKVQERKKALSEKGLL